MALDFAMFLAVPRLRPTPPPNANLCLGISGQVEIVGARVRPVDDVGGAIVNIGCPSLQASIGESWRFM